MIELGKKQTLLIVKSVEFGVYLPFHQGQHSGASPKAVHQRALAYTEGEV